MEEEVETVAARTKVITVLITAPYLNSLLPMPKELAPKTGSPTKTEISGAIR